MAVLENFSKIYLHCFDLAQYNPNSTVLNMCVFANIEELTFVSDDYKLDISMFNWVKDKWVTNMTKEELNTIAIVCLHNILDKIKEQEFESQIFYPKHIY